MAVQDFKDKVVIITGASAGVGEACARCFANAGAKLVLVARSEAPLNALAQELSAQVEVLAVPMDVADSQRCEALIEATIEKFGAIHLLVNNAGLHRRGDVVKRSPADVSAMVDVNVRAPLHLTALVLPVMSQQREGAVVMVGSLAGRAPLQGAATYSATKAGLRTFAFALNDELRGSGVSAGIVSPGPIDTGFIMNDIDQVEDIVYSQPMSTPEQVAAAVVQVARAERVEVVMPAASGFLTTLSYLFPRLRRAVRPFLYWLGRQNKKKYRQ